MSDMTLDGLPFEVRKSDTIVSMNKAILIAHVTVDPSKPEQISQAITALRSSECKSAVVKEAAKMGYGNYGIAVAGGPHPFRDEADGGLVKGYQLDFRLTANI
jgi:hypothetical protein